MTRYPPEALRALLARHMLFRDASAALLDGLVKFATVRHFQPNDEVFAKGDPGNTLCGVLAGRVCIYTVSSEGEEAILNILEPGEIFGEIALLDGGPRTASARAMTAVDLLQIHRDHFVPFLHDHPELGVSILPVLCGRIRMNVEFIEDAVFLHLPARLAKRLLSLAEVHGKPDARGVRIAFKLSQQDLAHMIGATRERVNKELGLWRERGVIAVEDGMILICEPEALKAMVAEETS
jgi:CRP/FNR family transcriptional regulator, cyclic AMP receptor protein